MAQNWQTKLIHSSAKVPGGFRALSVPVERASTVVFSDCDSAVGGWDVEADGYTYGIHGTPTVHALAGRIAELEGGARTLLVPSGLAALTLVDMAMLSAGSHVLLPDNVYVPNRLLAIKLLHRFGVEGSFYPADAGAKVAEHFRPNTHLIWVESPGSITMEVQDVPAIAAAAHAHGVIVAIDNTWAAGVLFKAFEHGVDVSVQALTKYVGGHSDLLLGSVTVRNEALLQRLGETRARMGISVSPDECSLALRGLQTLAVRLRHAEASALMIANWLAAQPEVQTVLHPALESCPGHTFWKRDFSGASGLFSLVFHQKFSGAEVRAFVDALDLFEIGYSWAGTTSLAVTYNLNHTRGASPYGDRLVRLSVGMEETDDLIDDLKQALARMRDSH
ncbi:cystathionine beta-lyase [Telmatobacter bradus]|uniref:cystathionine beta-lyase n=1 Tax=Telmatobacter bradus TaxID=474953 RepID=UPI003B4280F0